MLLPRKCSTISSIFAPPNVSLEFGIKWPPNHAHFCAPQLRPRSPAQRGGSPESRVPSLSRAGAQNRGCLIFHAGPRGSMRFASPYLPRALRGARRLLRPSESRAPYLPRRAPGIHQICEFHIFHARFGVPRVCCDPSESRAPYLPRRAPGIHQICEFHICRACFGVPIVCCDPSESRAPYLPRAAPGIQQICEFHIFHARFMAPSVRCDPSESRVCYDPRTAPGIHQTCEFHIFHARFMAPSVCRDPSDSRVCYVPRAAPGIHQICEFHIFHARFMAPSVCCDPSDSRVCYVPRAAPDAEQKNRWILLGPFRNASVLCSTHSPRGPAEKWVDFIETLQKCKCFMFHAQPARSSRKMGGFY